MKKIYFSLCIISFILGLKPANAQVGSLCTDPFVISALPFQQTGLNTNTTADNYDSGPCTASSTFMAGNDFVFTYTPVSNEIVNISLANVSSVYGSGIFVTDSCPDNFNSTCIAQANSTIAIPTPSIINLNLTAGTQYFFIVSTQVVSIFGQPFGQTTGFDIMIQPCTLPEANFNHTQNGYIVSFLNTSTNSNTYEWLFGDEQFPTWFTASTDTNPVHTYPGYGTYTVQMVATNSCGSTDTIAADIILTCPGPVPIASFIYTADNTTVNFNNTSVNAASSSWLFGDEPAFPPPTGDPTTNPVHFYAQAGTYIVELTITSDSGCQSIFTDTITVTCNLTSIPVADFTFTTVDTTVFFTNISVDATNYSWLYGDEPPFPPANGDTTTNPDHTYNGWGTYDVQLTASNCFASSTITIPITICYTDVLPVANFTFTQNGLDISFTNTSTESNTYQWLFGDTNIPPPFHWINANTETSPVHTYPGYGTYTVEMVATNLCGITDTIAVNITLSCPGPVPAASFNYTADNTIVTFNNTSINAASSSWLFGDELPFATGDTTENPVHTYAQAGTYTVELTITSDSGCQSVFTDTIVLTCNLTSIPVASFDHSISDTTVTFTNTSVDGSIYQWLFGDELIPIWQLATSGANQIHPYNGSGTYTVQMIAANCFSSDTIVFDITICALPQASFTDSISGMNVIFNSTATNTISHQWFFGDETNGLPSDTTANPSHTYIHYGTFHVTYVALNDCGTDTQKTSITILCPDGVPNANFTYVLNEATVQFTDSSMGNSLLYAWYFGDEINPINPSAFTANPTHTYTQGGTYIIRLITTNNCGTDTAFATITIVGIEQIINNIDVSIYPNPVKDVLNIEVNDLTGKTLQLSVQNILCSEIYGETFISTTNTYLKQLSIKELAKGIYFIKINCDKGSKIIRIISE